MKISEIMNKAFVIDEDISLKEAARMMAEKKIGSLIIMKKDKIGGIITESDITKNFSKAGKRVKDIMSSQVVSIGKDDSIDNAARLMSKHKIKRLPVIHKNELVGIVTASEILGNSDELNEEFFID